MTLAIRTDTAVADLALFAADGTRVTGQADELGRQMARLLPGRITGLLATADAQLSDLTGIIFFAGPGSFTGLRIGAAVANALAYGQDVPVVAVRGDDWLADGLARLRRGEADTAALPFYGAEARVTQPRK